MTVNLETSEESAQPPRLAELLPRWLELPVYRGRRTLEEASGGNALARFAQIPFITKRELRDDFPRNFLGTDRILETLLADNQVEVEHTSGTSEERTPVLLGRGWWAEQELRALRLNDSVARILNSSLEPRRVVLTTPMCNGTVCHSRWSPRSARTDGVSLSVNQARIPFLLTDDELARMAVETGEWAPLFLDLDPVQGAWFAMFCERRGIRFPSLKFLLCSYEFESVVHRRILERAFGVPVFNLYGSTETGHLLMEDEHGRFKPSRDTAFLEVVEVDADGVGDLVVTTLSNDFMPLLRYRIGDLVQRDGAGAATTYLVHGRARDALTADDGHRVTTLEVDRCFADVEGIAHYELRQAENGEGRLRFVPDNAGPSTAALRELTGRLDALLRWPHRIAAEAVRTLVPAPSGKFRLTAVT